MPKWEPGMKQGEYVNVSFTVPINFVLEGAAKNESLVGAAKQPLLIVDGKEIDYNELEKIDPKQIESIDVLKEQSAIEKYGKKGENGVVIVNTKFTDAEKNTVHVVSYAK